MNIIWLLIIIFIPLGSLMYFLTRKLTRKVAP